MEPEKRVINPDFIKLNGECFFDTDGICQHKEKNGIKYPVLKCKLYKYIKRKSE